MENILLNNYQTPYNTAPFSKISNNHFFPAFKKAIENAKSEIDTITSNTEEPTFENTIEALEFSGEPLDRVSSIFFNLTCLLSLDSVTGCCTQQIVN